MVFKRVFIKISDTHIFQFLKIFMYSLFVIAKCVGKTLYKNFIYCPRKLYTQKKLYMLSLNDFLLRKKSLYVVLKWFCAKILIAFLSFRVKANNYFFLYFCLFYSRYKMSANTQQITHYQRKRDKILNKAKEYYQINKEKRKEYRKNRYHNMAAEEKNKVNEYRKNWYRQLDQEKKNKFREYARNRYYAVSVC